MNAFRRDALRVTKNHYGQLGRRRVSIWGSETASRHEEIEFLVKVEDFSIFRTFAFLGVVSPDVGRTITFSTEHGLRREYHHSTDLTLLYPKKILRSL